MQPVHRADNLASFMFQLSRNPGTLNLMKQAQRVCPGLYRDNCTFTDYRYMQGARQCPPNTDYRYMQGARQCPPNTDAVCYGTFLMENFTEIVGTFNCR